MASTRRLAAILAADVAGYSRLMGEDEEGTHERVKAHLAQLVDPKISEHRGRIVKNTGDGLLAEFPSVVDAVRCAVEIQRGMIDREPEVRDERRIRFRIGVNLGDVIAEPEDIFGDGVNIAARLETLAKPGGICISRVVRDQVRDKLPYPFEDVGEQCVKNIARPVRVYALLPEPIADLPAPSVRPASPISQPAVAPRLSIVVLPFTNLSDDREQQYFADGITEDLTTDLSRISGSFVIARNTAFTYKGQSVDVKRVSRELGVRYVLEGSVRRVGDQVRVNVQLVDGESGALSRGPEEAGIQPGGRARKGGSLPPLAAGFPTETWLEDHDRGLSGCLGSADAPEGRDGSSACGTRRARPRDPPRGRLPVTRRRRRHSRKAGEAPRTAACEATHRHRGRPRGSDARPRSGLFSSAEMAP